MTTEYVKQEIIKRYKYLYENAQLLLGLYVKECSTNNKKYVGLYVDEKLYPVIEEFLFTEDEMESSILYIWFEDLKQNKNQLELIKENLEIVKKYNESMQSDFFRKKLDITKLLENFKFYLKKLKNENKSTEKKFIVLDEYYRLLRYSNDGKIYISGSYPSWKDYPNMHWYLSDRVSYDGNSQNSVIANNKFIDFITKMPHYECNGSIFTEEEKEEVYLELHDELPYGLCKSCEEDELIPSTVESKLKRPENTKACHEIFRVDEKEIFINLEDDLERYYQLCAHCGYIVEIPKEIIPESVKQRIKERCSQDKDLYRKNILKSELQAFENKSQEGNVRMLK